MSNTNVICIVPVKNESWILKNFIQCAKAWADFIIVGDNRSADDSTAIAQAHGCEVIDLGPAYDESNRRQRLLDAARKIPGRRLIISIDADEALSANWARSPEWARMLDAAPGERFQFDWVELLPGLEQCVINCQVAAFLDDGSEYCGVVIHSPRIPITKGKTVKLNEIKLLHYITVDPGRMFSRHRWYKCLEYIEHGKRPWETCVTYQDIQLKTYDAPLVPVKEEWLRGYTWLEEFRSQAQKTDSDEPYWWDGEVLNYFDRHGVDRFRKINIWDVDWNKKARLLGRTAGSYTDPRTPGEKLTHRFIQKYRAELKLQSRLPFKVVNKLAKVALKRQGW